MSNVTYPATLSAMFMRQVSAAGSRPAMHFVRNQETVTWSWNELDQHVAKWTAALHEFGIRSGDHVVHWSPNRFEWILTDLALNCLGAVHVPIHSTLSNQQTVEQMVHSESRFAIVANQTQLRGLSQLATQLDSGIRFCSYEKATQVKFGEVTDLAALAQAADATAGHQLAAETAQQLDPDAVTTILYTSGTTGEPKGIMLSQRNLMSNAIALVGTFSDEEPLELRLNFLPLSHIFARTCDTYTWLVRGSEIALTQSRETIIDDCKRFKPTLINGVPFFFERVRQKIEEKGVADQPGILKKTFGGEIRGCFSGGGALANQTYDFYESQDVPLMQGYGLTESSPVISFSTLEERKRGSAGPALGGVEIRIAEDGEILSRGPHIMLGYWKDTQSTKQTLRDGWLHTGDLGRLDADGHLWITGRKKEMIVTSTGKNIFPSQIEELLCRDPLILQAVVFGDRRDCLAALIVPDPEILKAEIKRRRIWVFSRKGAVRHRRVVQLYRERIDHQLRELAHHEQVPLFRVLDRGFTIEDGYMTAKLSLRRNKIEEDFAREIEELYAKP